MRLIATRWLSIALLFSILSSLLLAQTPSFKVESSTVVVDVIVTDKKGHPILGLKKEQFKVTEDNVAQQVDSMTPPPDLVVRPSVGAASPANNTPAADTAGTPRPQNITLLIDLGGLQFESLQKALNAASAYVEKTVDRGNKIAIYWVDDSLHLAVPFTDDKPRLLEALDKLSRRAPNGRLTARDRVNTQNRIDDLFEQVSQGGSMKSGLVLEMNMLRSWLTIASTYQARAVFVALRALCVGYGNVPGHKSVVIFSEGFLHAPDAGQERQAAIDAANRNGVTFYVIDTVDTGTTMSADSRSPNISGHRSDPDPGTDGFAPTMGLNSFDWMATLSSDVHGDVGDVAQSTGGFLIKNTNELSAALDRIEQDGSQYYSLAYQPTNRTYDGQFRKISVAIEGGNYRLRYRRGYWGIPPGHEVMMTPAGAQLLYALDSGASKPNFVPDLTAVFVPGRPQGFAVPVAVSLPGKTVPFDKKKDQYSANVTLLLVARDAAKQPVAVFERYGSLHFDKHDWEQFQTKLFNVAGNMPVSSTEPITIQALVRFSEKSFGASETVVIKPNASESGLWLTSLVLASRIEPADCQQDPNDPLCLTNMRIYLPSHAKFMPTDRMILSFAAEELAANPQTHQPDLRTNFKLTIAGQTTRFVPTKIQAQPGTKAGSLNVLALFDISKLSPGTYTLEATAEDGTSHTKSSRQVTFEIVPAGTAQ